MILILWNYISQIPFSAGSVLGLANGTYFYKIWKPTGKRSHELLRQLWALAHGRWGYVSGLVAFSGELPSLLLQAAEIISSDFPVILAFLDFLKASTSLRELFTLQSLQYLWKPLIL